MEQEKYIGMDVHQATISVAVMDCRGKLIMECILETKAVTILQFFRGLRGGLSVTFEEGTSGLFQAALPASILCVVELSTLKVRITGSASSRCRTISWIAGYCSRWYSSASS